VFILDSLSNYTPLDSREAEGIIERVAPRLQHANSAVVMSAVRIILKYMDEITSQDIIRTYSKKLTPPLVTLLNSGISICTDFYCYNDHIIFRLFSAFI
jgi:AP-1 complex subunit beta-1